MQSSVGNGSSFGILPEKASFLPAPLMNGMVEHTYIHIQVHYIQADGGMWHAKHNQSERRCVDWKRQIKYNVEHIVDSYTGDIFLITLLTER